MKTSHKGMSKSSGEFLAALFCLGLFAFIADVALPPIDNGQLSDIQASLIFTAMFATLILALIFLVTACRTQSRGMIEIVEDVREATTPTRKQSDRP